MPAARPQPRSVCGSWSACSISRSSALTLTGSRIATDLIVSDVFVTDRVELGHRKLVEFAARLGYRRVWFGNEVVAMEPALLGGTWRSTCRNCGLTWTDSTDGFWLHTRGMGYFPPVCALCSHPIAQPVGEGEPARRSPSAEPGRELETVPVQPGGRAAD